MAKKEDKKLTKDQAEKKILTLKKDLFNIRFKKINNQINNKSTIVKVKELQRVTPSVADYCWIISFFSAFIVIQFF